MTETGGEGRRACRGAQVWLSYAGFNRIRFEGCFSAPHLRVDRLGAVTGTLAMRSGAAPHDRPGGGAPPALLGLVKLMHRLVFGKAQIPWAEDSAGESHQPSGLAEKARMEKASGSGRKKNQRRMSRAPRRGPKRIGACDRTDRNCIEHSCVPFSPRTEKPRLERMTERWAPFFQHDEGAEQCCSEHTDEYG